MLVLTGGSTVSFSGGNSYSGTTTVSTGTTLQALALNTFSANSLHILDSNTSTLNLNNFSQTIANLSSSFGGSSVLLGTGTLTLGGDNGSQTFAGAITQTGGVTKIGTGTFTLSGANSYSGATNVNAGRMNVNGSSTSSNFTVVSGATLGGTGSIGGNVTVNSGGKLQPGSSIGTLTLTSPHTFIAGSIFVVEVAPNNVSSLLNITAGAPSTVDDGAIIQVVADPGSYANQQLYTIINAPAGITVNGSGFVLNNPYPFLNLDVIYSPTGSPTQVLLGVQAMPFGIGTGGLSPNAAAVAQYLDASAPIPPGTDFNMVVSVLKLVTSIGQLNDYLLQLEPSHLKALPLTQAQESHYTNLAVANRMESLFRTSCIRATGKKSRTTLWSSFWGDYAHQQGTGGYRAKTGGAILGVDRTMLESVCLGVAEGYSYSHVDSGHLGDSSVQSFYTTLYGAWFSDHLFVDASLLGAYGHYASKRHVQMGTNMLGGILIDRHPSADWGGGEVGAYLSGGAMFNAGGIDFFPSLTGEYYFIHQGSFQEAGGDSIDLSVKSRNNDVLRLTLGLDLTKCFARSYGKWIPEVALNVVHEQSFLPGDFHSTMKGNPTIFFETKGISGSGTYIMPVAALTLWLLEDRLSLFLQYTGQFNGQYSDNQGSFQAAYAF